jgi:hypothetical protein
MNIFQNFKSEKPAVNVLGAGEHVVRVNRIFEIDSFTNINGSAKADQPWDAPTPQLAVQLGNDKGVITERLNGLGYDHSDDYTPEQLEKAGLVDVDGYVAKDLGNGKFQRIPSEARTESCRNILNRFLWACGVPEGTALPDFVTTLGDNEVMVTIKVEASEHKGKTHYGVASFSQVKANEPTLELK